MGDNTLYDLLGVHRNATKHEIRKAYHKLAKQYHPDKNRKQAEECETKFKEMSYAYDILSDPQKRQNYDRFGLHGIQQQPSPSHFHAPAAHASPMGRMFGGSFHDHIFSTIFGEFGFPGFTTGPVKGADCVHQLKVTLEDLYCGKTTKLKLLRQAKCRTCNGIGGTSKITCPYCKGHGARVSFREFGPGMLQPIEKSCSECSGQGQIINYADRCKNCIGKGYANENKILDVQICAGMRDGQRIVFAGEGDESPNILPGDVVIVLTLQPHEKFELIGDDLFMKMDINITQALCGFRIPVKHLDSRDIIINSPSGKVIAPDSIKKIENEGFPSWPKKGDLVIKFNVHFPEHNFAEIDSLSKISKFLPNSVPEIFDMEDENVEAVELTEYEHINHAEPQMDEHEDGEGVHCITH